MRPCVLNSAGERDRSPFGQCGDAEIDFVVGQLPADARIEGTVVLGLRERQARRGDRPREHGRERASIDEHGYSSQSKACSGYLMPTRETAQATRTAILVNRHSRDSVRRMQSISMARRAANDVVRYGAYLKYLRSGGFWPFFVGMRKPSALIM